MKIRTKLKGHGGFSLAETMLAVLILLLVSVIMANGIPVARNVYNNVIVGANAQTLLSTTVSALRNELGSAQQVQIKNDKDIIYYKNSIGAYSKLSSDATKTIQLLDYVNQNTGETATNVKDAKGNTVTPTSRPLVSDAASNGNLKLIATYESVEKNGSIITFHNIQVRRSTDETVLAKLERLDIRLSPITD